MKTIQEAMKEQIKDRLRDRLLRMGLIGNDGGHEHALDLLTEDVFEMVHDFTD